MKLTLPLNYVKALLLFTHPSISKDKHARHYTRGIGATVSGTDLILWATNSASLLMIDRSDLLEDFCDDQVLFCDSAELQAQSNKASVTLKFTPLKNPPQFAPLLKQAKLAVSHKAELCPVAQYDPELLLKFKQASTLIAGIHSFKVWHNGPRKAGFVQYSLPNVQGLIMPYVDAVIDQPPPNLLNL